MYEAAEISHVDKKDIPVKVEHLAKEYMPKLKSDICYIRVVKSTGSISLYTEENLEKEFIVNF